MHLLHYQSLISIIRLVLLISINLYRLKVLFNVLYIKMCECETFFYNDKKVKRSSEFFRVHVVLITLRTVIVVYTWG